MSEKVNFEDIQCIIQFLIPKSQFYIMMSEIYISRRWVKLPLAENIRDIGTSVNTVASLLIEFKKYI